MIDAYGAVAQYQDLLMAGRRGERIRTLVTPFVPEVRRGVLDLGAGTGFALAEVARLVPDVPLTAVEPSAAMRTALFTRLADDPGLRDRTTVLPVTAERLELSAVADLALVLDTSPVFPPIYRSDIWERLHRALTPDAILLLDRPGLREPEAVPETSLGQVRVGRLTLSGSYRGEPAGQRQWWEFRYRLTEEASEPEPGGDAPSEGRPQNGGKGAGDRWTRRDARAARGGGKTGAGSGTAVRTGAIPRARTAADAGPATTVEPAAVAEEVAEYYTWPAEPDELVAELAEAGFVLKETVDVDGAVLVLRRD
jgi:SAM-dependent methyltransferase